MPYTNANDDKLPEKVKKLSPKKRRQWVAVFNSAYKRCETKGGEDCEASAFAQANGVVREVGEVEEAKVSEYYDGEAMASPAPSYIPWDAKSFADLEAFKENLEAIERVEEYTEDFNALCRNIMADNSVQDKAAQLRALTDEFISKIGSSEPPMGESAVETEGVLAESESGYVVDIAEGSESTSSGGGPVVMDVVLVEPGWGNTRDNYYYPKEMLVREAEKFVGAKMYVTNHMDKEKSVRTEVSEILGIRGFTPTGGLIAKVGVFDEGFAQNVRNRKALGTLRNLHCSINGDGILGDSYTDGTRRGRRIDGLKAIDSVDWVRRAGAGGHALDVAESAQGGEPMPEDMTPSVSVDALSTDNTPTALDQPTANVTQDVAPAAESAVHEEVSADAPVQESRQGPEIAVLSEADVQAVVDDTRLPSPAKNLLKHRQYATLAELHGDIREMIDLIKTASGAGQVVGLGERQPQSAQPMTTDEYERRMQGIMQRTLNK